MNMTIRVAILMIVAALLAVARAASADDPAELTDLMARGKLAADLGDHPAAVEAFAAVAQAPGASPALRAEARVRLGSARLAAGDHKGAVEAFDRAWRDHGRDREALALLVRAAGGALPGPDRWAAIWNRVIVTVDRSDPARPRMRVIWPDVPPYATGPIARPTDITLDFKDGNLNDIFRLFADITGLNVVVFPGIRGTITVSMQHVPWPEALERVLTPYGMVFRVDGNVLWIGPPARLGAPPKYAGQAIDVDFKDEDLRQALASLARSGKETLVVDPVVEGRVTLKLEAVPWDQALDVVVRVNGLAWSREGGAIRVGPRPRAR
jgi:tetratricopeptide (TPR) repeat protein